MLIAFLVGVLAGMFMSAMIAVGLLVTLDNGFWL